MRRLQSLVARAGTLLLGVAGVAFGYCLLDGSEKPGQVYAFGHWIHLWYEVAAPSAALGGVLLATWVAVRQRSRQTRTRPRGFDVVERVPGHRTSRGEP